MQYVKLFTPHIDQQRILDEFVIGHPDRKWCTLVVGRQWGKSLLAMNAILYWALNNPKSISMYLSLYNSQLEYVMYQMSDTAAEVIQSKNIMAKRIVLNNGSEILFKSAENAEAIRGFTFDYAVWDEAAFIKDDILKVIRPTLAVHGKKCLIVSTPYIKNWFYDYAMMGENPEKEDYVTYRGISTDNPYFLKAELEAAEEIMPKDAVRQEFYAEFVESGGGVFTGFHEHTSIQEYKVEEFDQRCYVGIDIAIAGKERSDWTCVVIMNHLGDIINVERWKDGNTENQIRRIRICLEAYDIHRGFIEINQERGIYQKISLEFPTMRDWTTTRKNKPDMIQNLKNDIEKGKLRLPSKELDPQFFFEFGNFTQEQKPGGYIQYSAPDGMHDDSVIATALANEARVPGRHGRNFFVMNLEGEQDIDPDERERGTIEKIKLNQNGKIR